MTFEFKRDAYMKYTQYMILAAKAIEPVLAEDDDIQGHADMLKEMEEAKAQLEACTNMAELDAVIAES